MSFHGTEQHHASKVTQNWMRPASYGLVSCIHLCVSRHSFALSHICSHFFSDPSGNFPAFSRAVPDWSQWGWVELSFAPRRAEPRGLGGCLLLAWRPKAAVWGSGCLSTAAQRSASTFTIHPSVLFRSPPEAVRDISIWSLMAAGPQFCRSDYFPTSFIKSTVQFQVVFFFFTLSKICKNVKHGSL